MNERPIIVLTPIKNEEWIIGSFLDACSRFADHIILLFQDTDDRSREIAATYPKTILLENNSKDYSERSRINQLIAAARDVAPEGAALLALDADEIPIHSNFAAEEWSRIRNLESGRNISFKKPDLLPGGASIVDLDEDWILGFVDDYRAYEASEVHAQRVPVNADQRPYKADSIPILHLNLVREKVNRAKRRMYCVIENSKQLQPLRRRLINYRSSVNHATAGRIIDLPPDWVDALEELDLCPSALPDKEPYWQNYEVLKHFRQYGEKQFYWDDIWDHDWEATRQRCKEIGWSEVPDQAIRPPAAWVRLARKLLTQMILAVLRLKRMLS